MNKVIKIGFLGCGNVGGGVWELLQGFAPEISHRDHVKIRVKKVLVRDVNKARSCSVPAEVLTDNPNDVLFDPEISLVAEFMGGEQPATEYMLRALNAGKTVVTANKVAFALHWHELQKAAKESGAGLYYEAAVCGAIPIIHTIEDSLQANRIDRLYGIVNGTTNYILDAMDSTGAQFADALAEAQRLGYAEADPTADVEGHDAAAKGAILASLAFHTTFEMANVSCEGITSVTAADIAAAKDAGFVIKLLAIAEKLEADGAEGVSVRVHPTLLPRTHPLAAVHGAFNAVFVEAENAGELMFYGQGAGGAPTASAVMGDVVSTARRLVLGGPLGAETPTGHVPALPFEKVTTSYSIGLEVTDQPGVLAAVARVFAENGVSIETMRQTIHSDGAGTAAELRFVTHRASEAALAATVEAIKGLDVINSVTSVLRVEGV